MNSRALIFAGAAIAALGSAAPAQAITVQLDFTANFAAGSPETTVAGQFCCLTAVVEDCGQPGVITYACAAVEDGGAGCLASALALPPQQAGDEDASYPVGCAATLPSCDDGQAPKCTCVLHAAPGWSCAY